jgi:hypothetical protein
MKFVNLSQEQVSTVVEAMYAVVSASGQIAPLEFEIDCINAVQRQLLLQHPPLPGHPGPLPASLSYILDTSFLRKSTIRLLAALSIVDRQVSAAKVAVVEDAARTLKVSEYGLVMLRRVARGQYRRNALRLMQRFVNHYWSYSGHAELRDWAAILWPLAPWLPGLRSYLRLEGVVARYSRLAALPSNTLGYAVYRYYQERDFPMPGQPKSIPEGWARHEVYHVLANYNTNLQGELLLAGFISGNTDELCLDILLPALVQLHAGKAFVPGPVAEGILIPDDFFQAVSRGAAMNIDLLAGWRLWDVAHERLEDLRQRYGIPPLPVQAYARLMGQDALLLGVGGN